MKQTQRGQSLNRILASGTPPEPRSHSQVNIKPPGTPAHPVLSAGHYVLPNFAVRSSLFKATAPNRHFVEKDDRGVPLWTENRGLDGYQHFYCGELLTVYHGIVYGHALALCWPTLQSGERVYFRLYKLLKVMGSKTGGSNYESLKKALITLSNCELSPGGGKNIGGKLLEFGYDDIVEGYYVQLPEWIRQTLTKGEYTVLNTAVVKGIKGYTAKALYPFFNSHDIALDNGITIEFLQKNIVGSSAKTSVFSRLMPFVAGELTRIGVLTRAAIIDGKLIYDLPLKPKSVRQRIRRQIKHCSISNSVTPTSNRPPPKH